jgi:hypothetical protein
MAKDALAMWLVPTEFMDVNYGRPLKEYLLKRVGLLRIHRFDPGQVQFDDALVSSAVVCIRNSPPQPNHVVHLTYGGSLTEPAVTRTVAAEELDPARKWLGLFLASGTVHERRPDATLSDLFVIKRGIATGANQFFVLEEATAEHLCLPRRFLRPIFPSPRYLTMDEIDAEEDGSPKVEPRLVLLDCRLPEDEVRSTYPKLWDYLQTGIAKGVDQRYLCRHRTPWYAQEDREPAPFLCTYMGRTGTDRGAFRFILNRSLAIAANVYLMLYPRAGLARALDGDPELARAVWSALRRIPSEALAGVGRVYGGGLHKLEPRELSAAPLDALVAALPDSILAAGRQTALSL